MSASERIRKEINKLRNSADLALKASRAEIARLSQECENNKQLALALEEELTKRKSDVGKLEDHSRRAYPSSDTDSSHRSWDERSVQTATRTASDFQELSRKVRSVGALGRSTQKQEEDGKKNEVDRLMLVRISRREQEMEQNRAAIQEELVERQREISELEMTTNEKKTRITFMRAQIGKLRQEQDVKQTKRDCLKERKKSLMHDRTEDVHCGGSELQERIDQLQQRVKKQSSSLELTDGNIETLTYLLSSIRKQREQTRDKREDKQMILSALQAAIKISSASRRTYKAQNALAIKSSFSVVQYMSDSYVDVPSDSSTCADEIVMDVTMHLNKLSEMAEGFDEEMELQNALTNPEDDGPTLAKLASKAVKVQSAVELVVQWIRGQFANENGSDDGVQALAQYFRLREDLKECNLNEAPRTRRAVREAITVLQAKLDERTSFASNLRCAVPKVQGSLSSAKENIANLCIDVRSSVIAAESAVSLARKKAAKLSREEKARAEWVRAATEEIEAKDKKIEQMQLEIDGLHELVRMRAKFLR